MSIPNKLTLRFATALLLAAVLGAGGSTKAQSTAAAQLAAKAGKLTVEQELRAQVQQLSDQLLQAQVSFAQCRSLAADVQARFDSLQLSARSADLQAKREALEKEIRSALSGGDDDVVDWTTMPPSLKKRKQH